MINDDGNKAEIISQRYDINSPGYRHEHKYTNIYNESEYSDG